MIKYIGSKRVLVPTIAAAFSPLPRGARVLDLFSGTSRVGHALKAAGLHVTANDHNRYAWHLAGALVGADADRIGPRAEAALEELRRAPPVDGWFTELYARQSRYLHPDNAVRIEGMRQALDAIAPPATAGPDLALRHVLLTALLLAADRVDSTVGVQMAWLKQWAGRALRPLDLLLPPLLPGPGAAWCDEAWTAATAFHGDAAYLDPPYNQHSYLGNYHLWETLVRWDRPEVYGVACKRVDVKVRRSPFNSRPGLLPALARTLEALDVPVLVLSFSDEGVVERQALEELLAPRGHVEVLERAHPRYVGARIGIYNDKGDRVGVPGHLHNTERLYIVAPQAGQAAAMRAAAAAVP